MTAYQEFIENPNIEKGKIARLWELEINGKIENLLEFCREFLRQKGFKYTGYQQDEYGEHKAVFNNSFIFDGAIQEGNKVAIRIKQIGSNKNIKIIKGKNQYNLENSPAGNWTFKIIDDDNLVTEKIKNQLSNFSDSIYFNDLSGKYWIFDFKIDDVWFESAEINCSTMTMTLNAYSLNRQAAAL